MTEPARHPPAPPVDVEAALRRIREHGGRLTSAKRALAELLFAEATPLTAEEIADRLGDRDRSVVYRNLTQFEKLGIAEHLHLGHGRAVYRPAGLPGVPVRCRACGTVRELGVAEVRDLTRRVADLTGIAVDLTHFPLAGTCLSCRGEPDPRS